MNQVIVASIVSSAVYTIMALGLVAVFKTTRVFNFAHGQVAAFGGYMGYTVSSHWHLPFYLVALTGALTGVILGWLMDRLLSRLYHRSPLELVVATFGVSLILRAAIAKLWGYDAKSINAPFAGHNIKVIGTQISDYGLCLIVFGVLVVTAMSLVLARTELGLRLRCTFDDATAARLNGVRVARVRTLSWVVGGALGGLAGVLLTPLVFLTPDTMDQVLIIAFAAAVIGGFSSFYGAVLGGVIVAFASNLFANYVSIKYEDALLYGAVIVFLWVLPNGILGEPEEVELAGDATQPGPLARRMRGFAEAAGARIQSLRGNVMRGYPPQVIVVAIVIVAIFAAPTVLGSGSTLNLLSWLVNVVAVAGLCLTTFYAGRISLAQAAYMAIGAYATAKLLDGHPGSWPLVLLASFLIAAFAGLLFEIPAQRLRGAYYAVASLALALLVPLVATQWTSYTGGTDGQPVAYATWGGSTLTSSQLYLAFAIITAVVLLVLLALRNSPVGRKIVATRDSPAGAASLSLSATPRRIAVAAVGSGLGGLAGGMSALQNNVVTPASFDLSFALTLFVAVVIAGAIVGSAWGAAVVTLVPVWLASAQLYATAAFGAILFLTLFLLPPGRDVADVLRRRRVPAPGVTPPRLKPTLTQKEETPHAEVI